MNGNLTPGLESMIQDKVRSGLYNNQSEVVCEALRLMAEQERLHEAHLVRLREALADGLSQADRGELQGGPGVIEDLGAFLRDRRASSDPGE